MRSTLFRFFVVLSLLAGLLVVTAASGSAQPESVQVDGAGRGYYFVALDGPITGADAAALRAAGAELLAYEPDFAYQVRMAADAADVIAGLDGVTAVTSVRGADKLAGDLAATGLYRIRFQRGVDAAAAAVDIAAAGVQVLAAQGSVMAVQGDLAAMQSVAGLAEVAWVENHTFRETHNEYGAGSIVGTAAANANGYDGSTQTVAVADTGIGGGTAATAHIDIPSARVAAVYNWPGIPSAGCYNVIGDAAQDVDSGHGTHVAVSVLGDGNGTGVGTGSAPAARLVFQAIEDWADMISACALFNPDGYYLIGIPEDFTGLFQQAYDAGARIHSNSWGSDASGDYTSDSVTVDTFMWNHRDMLITYSAGNSGVDANADGVIDSDSIGSPATAKNTLTVGASERPVGQLELRRQRRHRERLHRWSERPGHLWEPLARRLPGGAHLERPDCGQRPADGGVLVARTHRRRSDQARRGRSRHLDPVRLLRSVPVRLRRCTEPAERGVPIRRVGNAVQRRLQVHGRHLDVEPDHRRCRRRGP
ncbi:hypothetical protein BH24ACT7_BH24ACT7_07930 [soil metagenome]